MTFLSLLTVLAVGVLVASLITNFLKGMVLVVSGLGICFYLFFADVEQKKMLDEYASQVTFTSVSNLGDTDYAQQLDSIVTQGSELIKSSSEELQKKISETTNK